MKTLWVLLLILVASFAQAQVHPYVAGGAALNPGGQASGGEAVAGIQLDAAHLFSFSEAGYETGGKTNDNDNTSSKGHTRVLRDETLLRFGNYYAGVGADWSKLYTPDYTKSHVHPKATVGREFHSGYVNKVLVSYVHPGTDIMNAVTGAEVQSWWTKQHAFLRMTVGIYRYHETVIPISAGGSAASVASELAHHSITGQVQVVAGWRF